MWKKERKNYSTDFKNYIKGVSRGLAIGVAIMLALVSGWYQRASMVAASKLNVFIFLVAMVGIMAFMSWLMRKYHFETNEQRYSEILSKIKKENENNGSIPF